MPNSKKRFIVTAGGTGGHIFPAVAIAEELIKRGSEILFVGNINSMEEQVITDLQLPFTAIDVQKLYRSITFKHLIFPYKLAKSIIKSGKIIKSFKPDACIGTGGFVSFPIVFRAAKSQIPVYIQEQNSSPGLTTIILSRYARKVFTGFESAHLHLGKEKCIYTGNPLRGDKFAKNSTKLLIDNYQTLSKEGSRKESLRDRKTLSLLVTGGSQGARFINEKILDLLPQLFSQQNDLTYKLYWQCGKGNLEMIRERLNGMNEQLLTDFDFGLDIAKIDNKDNHGKPSVTVFDFTDSIYALYDRVDIAVTRAGAISLAELETKKIPAIIIPIPVSAGNHQYLNAKTQEEDKKGILIEQKSFNNSSLLQAINRIADNYESFTQSFRESKHATAAKVIADYLIKEDAK